MRDDCSADCRVDPAGVGSSRQPSEARTSGRLRVSEGPPDGYSWLVLTQTRLLALTSLALVSCEPTPFVIGSWRFDGRSFGQHHYVATMAERDPCRVGSDPGSIELLLRLVPGDRGATQYANVTFFPQDDKRGVDVVMPWSHVRFAASGCSHRAGSAAPGVLAGEPILQGTLQLTCANQDDTLDVNISYKCPANGSGTVQAPSAH